MFTKRLTGVVDTLLKQHVAILVMLHTALILSSLTAAWLLQFDFRLAHSSLLIAVAPALLLIRLATVAHFKLLHGNWSYTGIDDATEIVKATGLGSVIFFLATRFLFRMEALPVSFYFTEGLVAIFLVGGTRLGFRILAEAANRRPPGPSRKQVVILGAGFAAQMIMRELRQNASPYWVLGYLDDDPQKMGRKIQGKCVIGSIDHLPDVAAKFQIDEVLIGIPSATGAQMRRFVSICEKAGLKSYTVPTLHDLISGKSKISELHEVNLDDLLGRQPVHVDLGIVREVLSDRVVVVTGAAGSIGSELCRQILAYGPSKLICVDQNETGLFYLQMELEHSANGSLVKYCVADYTDSNRMHSILSEIGGHIVFHAAAYKHVPLMEHNPREALRNNVFGLLRLLDVARAAQCESFILISSDKAVNPSSIMGCTKRIGELIMAASPHDEMKCVSVRFGNVLGSQGSVVPVFQKQLLENRRITVTHPEITRFFMTIREAVSLVLQAGAIGEQGDVLVLDMGEPVRIVDLARTLIRLHGKTEKDVEIDFTGLRPGEKLYEELFYADEQVLNTPCDKIKRTCGTLWTWPELKVNLDELKENMYDISEDELRHKLKDIVPEYVCPKTPQVESPTVVRIALTRAVAQRAGA